jgi:hypothetical protein
MGGEGDGCVLSGGEPWGREGCLDVVDDRSAHQREGHSVKQLDRHEPVTGWGPVGG